MPYMIDKLTDSELIKPSIHDPINSSFICAVQII